jgi:hypothetical protein
LLRTSAEDITCTLYKKLTKKYLVLKKATSKASTKVPKTFSIEVSIKIRKYKARDV